MCNTGGDRAHCSAGSFAADTLKQQIILSIKRDLKCSSQYHVAEKTQNKVERRKI